MIIFAGIKFNGVAGASLALTTGVPVALSNINDLNVDTWLWELIDAPNASALYPWTSALAAPNFTPDVSGTYLFQLTTHNTASGATATDRRTGTVLTTRGWAIPAASQILTDNTPAAPATHPRGWAGDKGLGDHWMEYILRDIHDHAFNLAASAQIIYIDAVYGSDTNDGSFDSPYRTFAYACTQQAYPTTEAEWMAPITFHLAPGLYTGPITLPQRLHMKIVGDNCSFTGYINWGINPQVWVDWGRPTTITPVLHIARSEPSAPTTAETDDGHVIPAAYPQGFQLVSGAVIAFNSNAVGANAMPDYHTLTMTGVYRYGFHIYNQPASAGLGVAIDAPKDMRLYLRDCDAANGIESRIFGEVNRDVGAGVLTENAVIINAIRSRVNMNAVCRIDLIEDCEYFADWRIDNVGAPYDYGLICGYGTNTPGGHIRNSTIIADSFFGFNNSGVLPVPKHTHADALVFDRDSLLNMASACTVLTTSFAGFVTTLESDAFGRGWYYNYDEQVGTHARVTIPCGMSDASWRLFAHTYNLAANWRVGGAVLSSNNRLSIELDSGLYAAPKATFLFDKEFVNVIGKGNGSARGRVGVVEPSTVLYHTNGMEWWAAEAHLEAITIIRSDSTGVDCGALLMKAQGSSSTFKKLAFDKNPASLSTIYAVMIDPALAPLRVRGTWEDCHTELAGFMYGGGFEGIASRCTVGNYSFAGWHGVAPLDVDCNGALHDCAAGMYSFGATDAGGNATFSGVANRCTVPGFGFGSTKGGGGAPFVGTCSGTLTDCDNYSTAGSGSFGYSESDVGVASGIFFRCSSGYRSFGCSTAAAANGIFSGLAEDCKGSYQCFGSNPTDPTLASCSGNLALCVATYQSFGARGSFTGRAYKCKATYGSFGWAISHKSGHIDDCEITDIRAAANQGPPGIWGAMIRNCVIRTKNGEDIAPLVLTGGTAAGNDPSRVINCDLYTNTHITSIDTEALGFYDVQLVHSRMNVDIDAVHVTNVIGVPYNVVDAAYDPT